MKTIFYIIPFICLFFLVGCVTPQSNYQSTTQPTLLYDGGFVLSAGQSKYWSNLEQGTYQFEVSSNDGVNIITFASQKDLQLYIANGKGVEAYSDCSTTESIKFTKQCTINRDGVFFIVNPNLLQETQVTVKITKIK